MELLVWQNDLNTGIEVIDNQHRRIVEMINVLIVAQQAGHSRSEVGDVLNDLVDYTLSHFAFEESLLEESGYSFTRPHKRVHEVFIGKVNEYNMRFKAGEDITVELINLLSRWLFNHIRNDDAAYAKVVIDNMNRITQDKQPAGWLSRSMRKFFG